MKWKLIHNEFNIVVNASSGIAAAKKMYRMNKAFTTIRVQRVDEEDGEIYTFDVDNLSFEKKNHRSHM